MRGIERILGVVIGGCSIYFGYRLFLQAAQHSAGGSATLSLGSKLSFAMQRVGPGVFFALFGAAIVGSAMSARLETKAPSGSELKYATPAALPEAERLGVRQRIAALNRVPGMLAPSVRPAEREELLRRLDEVKATLVSSIWDPAWGGEDKRTQFQFWVVAGARGDSLELAEAIRAFPEGEVRQP
jgi:hypothetical protein